MKTTVPTKLQKQIIDIVSAVNHPSRFSLHSNTTARCINYWVSGERLPRDIITIEDVMDAFGYEIVIRRKDDGKDIQSEAEQ